MKKDALNVLVKEGGMENGYFNILVKRDGTIETSDSEGNTFVFTEEDFYNKQIWELALLHLKNLLMQYKDRYSE